MIKTRNFRVLAVLTILLTIPVLCARAEDASGKAGESVNWSLDGGRLTISGTGAMYDYAQATTTPLPPGMNTTNRYVWWSSAKA